MVGESPEGGWRGRGGRGRIPALVSVGAGRLGEGVGQGGRGGGGVVKGVGEGQGRAGQWEAGACGEILCTWGHWVGRGGVH